MNKPYHIVIVTDEGYVQHAAVMLTSLFETNRRKIFHVYVLTKGLSQKSESRISSLCRRYDSYLTQHICSDAKIKDLPVGQWSTMMYYKLYIPTILPQEAERCLFLDVDMVINADIAELYNIELSDNVIAAAEDIPDCILHKQRIGLSQNDLYINSGVMVCDLKKWRMLEYSQPIFNFTRSVAAKIQNEQDVIAMYFKDKIKTLPIRWNMVTFYFMRKPKIFSQYLPQLKEAKRNPGIIHFACPIKPWFRDCNHPFGYLYRQYLQLTPWYDVHQRFPVFERLTLFQRFNKHIKNILNDFNILRYNEHLTQ